MILDIISVKNRRQVFEKFGKNSGKTLEGCEQPSSWRIQAPLSMEPPLARGYGGWI